MGGWAGGWGAISEYHMLRGEVKGAAMHSCRRARKRALCMRPREVRRCGRSRLALWSTGYGPGKIVRTSGLRNATSLAMSLPNDESCHEPDV